MNAKEKSLEETLKLKAPEFKLTEQENELVDSLVINYGETYLLPFCEIKEMEEKTKCLLRYRIINVASQRQGTLVESLKSLSSGSKWLDENYYNMIHANSDEERVIIEACQAGAENAFTYMYLLMGHKVTSFVYDIKFEGYRYVEPGDLYNDLLIELFRICCTYPLDKYAFGGLTYTYVQNNLMNFLYEDIFSKNDILSYNAGTKKRLNTIKKTLDDICDMDGKTSLSTEEIRNLTSARKCEFDIYHMISSPLSFDSNDGFLNRTVQDKTANISIEKICPEEENICQTVAKNLRFTEEEIDELINALIKHVEECHVTVTGKVRKISRRSLRTFCQKQGKTVNTRDVKRILEEYAFAKTGRKIFFA